MKKLLKSLVLFAAAAMALTSCENEAINDGIETNDTYTMTFTAGAPESRTSVAIDGATATYSWSADDQMGFVQYAVDADKTNRTGSKETTIEGNVATFTTEFKAQDGATAYNYAAYYPYTTPANDQTKTFDNIVLNFPARQAYTEGTFAPAADLLMSKTIEGKDLNAHGGNLEFARLVAVGKMTLSDIKDGETIKNVRFTIENAVLSGQVTLDFVNTTAEYATEGNNYIEVYGDNVGNEIIFTCFPGTYTGNYSIAVETDEATYLNEKSFTKDFTLTAGNVLAFNASAGVRTEKPAELTEDILNRAFTGVSNGAGYSAWTDKTGASGAVYAGQSAGGNDAIQLRKDSPSGIVTTTSGGYATKVTVAWNSGTTNGRTLEVYGKNSAYTGTSDLHSDATAGTLLGTIVYGTSTELAINYDFQYIGLRSKSGAMYLDEVEITWSEEATGNVPTQLATPSNVQATVNGKDVTLTWNTVENADSYSITVVGGNTYTTTELTKTLTMDAYETEYEFSIVATSDVIDYSTSEAAVITATTGEEPETPSTGSTDTIVFAELGYSDASTLGEIVVGKTTLNFTQGSASNPAKYYNSGSAARLYQNSTMTVTGEENISKIDFTFVSSSYNTLSTTTGTYSDTSWTGSASSITFTVGSSGQTRIVSMTITYGGGSSEGGEGGEGGDVVTPDPEDPETPDTGTKTLSCLFADNGNPSWGNSYAAHTFTYDVANINFGAASKQTGTITTMPVTKNGTVDVVMTNDAKLTAVTYNCAQWGSKTQTMKLYYSTDGSNFTEYTTNVTWSNFVLTCTSLPEGTVAVRAKGTNSSNQIGIESVVITYAN